jgi:hypothetical protein
MKKKGRREGRKRMKEGGRETRKGNKEGGRKTMKGSVSLPLWELLAPLETERAPAGLGRDWSPLSPEGLAHSWSQ